MGRTTSFACPSCGTGWAGVYVVGRMAECSHCGAVLVFDEAWRPRVATEQEAAAKEWEIGSAPAFLLAVLAVLGVTFGLGYLIRLATGP
jgi:hypothetical protein